MTQHADGVPSTPDPEAEKEMNRLEQEEAAADQEGAASRQAALDAAEAEQAALGGETPTAETHDPSDAAAAATAQADRMRETLDARAAAGVGDRALPKKDRPKPPSNGLNADGELDLDDFVTIKVRLGGKRWLAEEQTIEAQKEMTELGVAMEKPDATPAQQALNALDSLYPQIAKVLKDPETGEPPSREFVEKHMTSRKFGKLMEYINTEAANGDPLAA